MKILLLANNVFYKKNNGLYTFRAIGEFASQLIELGNEVEMLQTVLVKNEEFHDYNLYDSKVKIIAIKRFKFKLFTYLLVYLIGVWKVFRSDFIYIYYPTNYHFLAFFSIIFRKKYGLNVRGEKGINSWISKFLYKYAAVVFTVSPSFTELVNNSKGNGVTQRPGISYTYEDIINTKTIKNKSFYNILYLGRLDIEKGLVELFNAVKILTENKIDNFKLTVVGDGYHQDQIINLSFELNIDEYINFVGPITNVEKLKYEYINSDIFILPTHHEGFPRTLYEAMIFGVPVITTFVGGIPSLMKDGVNCLKIEPKSVESIVEKLQFVFNNYEIYNEILPNAEILIRNVIRKERPTHAEELYTILINS
jgi:glycosyltransferase involved in cell wall biosynthesis